jgi:DNA-binding response OmpR family regulator
MRMPEELQRVLEEQMQGRTILVVDDDQDLNNLVTQYLSQRYPDHEILQAFDGFDAGRMIAEKKPGLILLDIDLPGIDGHKLCRSIKQESGLGSPVIISISGLSDPEEEKQILEEGADAFLAKPVDMEKIGDTIDQLTTRSAAS